MQCPRCEQELGAELGHCAHCGLSFPLQELFDKLQKRVTEAQKEHDKQKQVLSNLQQELSTLNSFLQKHGYATSQEQTGQSAQEKSTPINEPLPLEKPSAPSFSQLTPGTFTDIEQKGKAVSKASTEEPKNTFKDDLHEVVGQDLAQLGSEFHFGQTGLLFVGLAVMVIGIGFFLKYSFDHNLIGPWGRVGLGYLFGAACVGAGEFFRRRSLGNFGLYLIGGGLATFYFSAFASYQLYKLTGQSLTFALMTLFTLSSGGLAIKFDKKGLAILGLIGGFVTPLVLGFSQDSHIGLLTYILILNCGILSIAAFKQWILLNYLGYSFTWMLFSSLYFGSYNTDRFVSTLLFTQIFFITYMLAPMLAVFLKHQQAKVTAMMVMLTNALIAFSFSAVLITKHYSLSASGMVATLYAAFFFILAFGLYRISSESRAAIAWLLFNGALFVQLSVPFFCSQHHITIAWSVLGLLLFFGAIYWKNIRLIAAVGSFILINVLYLLLYNYPSVFKITAPSFIAEKGFYFMLVQRWLTILMVFGTLFVAIILLRRLEQDADPLQMENREQLGGYLRTVFWIGTFLLLHYEIGSFSHQVLPSARFACISVLWAVFASVLMILGFRKNLPSARKGAIFVFMITVLKVFFLDMANVSTPFRIISFIILGLLMVSASFLYHKYAQDLLKEQP